LKAQTLPTLKIDLHIHTNHSDSSSTIHQVIQRAKERGLDGIAITDHMNTMAFREIPKQVDGILIIPGVEVESRDGHVLVLGVRRAPRGTLSLLEIIEWARREGGATVMAHPMVPGLRASEETIKLARPDAIETSNALVPLARYNRESRELAERLRLPQTGGSDSHRAETVGDMYTLVDARNRTVAGVVQAIKEGRVRPAGKRSRLSHRLLLVVDGGIYIVRSKVRELLLRLGIS
jgi:hypothetical protein